MKILKIGICGWGNVATGLFNTIKLNYELIQSNGNLDIEIVVIGARRDNPKCDPGEVKIERNIFDVLDHVIMKNKLIKTFIQKNYPGDQFSRDGQLMSQNSSQKKN